jgi:hypothetical protein
MLLNNCCISLRVISTSTMVSDCKSWTTFHMEGIDVDLGIEGIKESDEP